MYKIQANNSGTRYIDVKLCHLETIRSYSLFRNLTDSNGVVDENVLEKLKHNIRAILATNNNENKNLLDLCLDVIYNKNMKAFGLEKLIILYNEWIKNSNNI